MGLFDSFKTNQSTFPSDEREAILFLLYGAVSCDGALSDEERVALVLLVTKTRTLGSWPKDQMSVCMQRCMHQWSNGDKDALIRMCGSMISQDLRESVFINLCALVLADNELKEKEILFIEIVQTSLSIPDSRARELVDAMVLLKRL